MVHKEIHAFIAQKKEYNNFFKYQPRSMQKNIYFVLYYALCSKLLIFEQLVLFSGTFFYSVNQRVHT